MCKKLKFNVLKHLHCNEKKIFAKKAYMGKNINEGENRGRFDTADSMQVMYKIFLNEKYLYIQLYTLD